MGRKRLAFTKTRICPISFKTPTALIRNVCLLLTIIRVRWRQGFREIFRAQPSQIQSVVTRKCQGQRASRYWLSRRFWMRQTGKSTFMRRMTSLFGGKASPPEGGNPDSNTLISDTTTVLCLDDYHLNDRQGRKESGLTALNLKEQNFD